MSEWNPVVFFWSIVPAMAVLPAISRFGKHFFTELLFNFKRNIVRILWQSRVPYSNLTSFETDFIKVLKYNVK